MNLNNKFMLVFNKTYSCNHLYLLPTSFIRCLAFNKIILRFSLLACPQAIISDKVRKQPKQISFLFEQQFLIQGD